MPRPIVGVGHSMGGAQLLVISLPVIHSCRSNVSQDVFIASTTSPIPQSSAIRPRHPKRINSIAGQIRRPLCPHEHHPLNPSSDIWPSRKAAQRASSEAHSTKPGIRAFLTDGSNTAFGNYQPSLIPINQNTRRQEMIDLILWPRRDIKKFSHSRGRINDG